MSPRFPYEALLAYAGPHLLEPDPRPYRIGTGELPPDYSVAVYTALAVDGSVAYVGSVARARASSGLRARLAEHARTLEKFSTWDVVYVVPLRPSTPVEEVRHVEGRIGAHLRPRKSRALPRIAGPR